MSDQTIACTNCGQHVQSNFAFCPHCQAKLADQAMASASLAQPPKKRGLGDYLGLGNILFGLVSLGALGSGKILSALIYAAGAVILTPYINRQLAEKMGKPKFGFGMRFLTGFLILIIAGAAAGPINRNASTTVADSSNQTQAEAPPAAKEAPAKPVKAAEPAKPAATIQTVTASQLLKAYENNKIKAEKTYKGQRMRFKGVVTSIGSDIMDQPYITIGTGEQFEVTSIQCFFGKEKADQLANLDKGQTITVEGTVSDYVMNILAHDCQL